MSRSRRRFRLPLWMQVLCGALLGAFLGVTFGNQPYFPGFGNEQLGQLGMLVIKLLRALAVPLILFAILDAFIRMSFTFRQGGKMVFFCLLNVSVAMSIGLVIMNVFQPGVARRDRLDQMLEKVATKDVQPAADKLVVDSHKGSLGIVENISSYIPKSVLDPFTENNVISVVLFALFTGAAIRRVAERQRKHGQASIRVLEDCIEAIYQVLVQLIEWVVRMVPFAVFGVIAQVVGKAGLDVFSLLWTFLLFILAGLAIHSCLYYPIIVWLLGGKSPRVYFGKGADAMITGLSCNSSLATMPVTLKCLDRMGVSPESARLAVCVGTNLNNDGITLYEAMAALFLAQAVGFDLGLSQQMTVVLASIMAGAGVAGIPEAGLVVLPLVLGAAGLSESVITLALPMVLTVDWIIARVRSGVNVMSDLAIAILLDGRRGAGPSSQLLARPVQTAHEESAGVKVSPREPSGID